MPDISTLMTILIAPLATLIGVAITLWNNRKTKRMELEGNRQLKLIELREQTAKLIREEKREVYLEILRAYKTTVEYWRQMGEWSLIESLQVDSKRIEEIQESLKDLIVQAELVATAPIYNLTRKLHTASGRCWQTHFEVNERLFAENAHLLDKQTRSPKEVQATAEAIWDQVRAEIKKAYEEQDMERLYVALRNQIREELGFLALSPELVPTPKDLESLSKELNELN